MPGNLQEQVSERLSARQGAPMQQLSRQDSGHPAEARAAAGGQWPAVSPRPHRESMDVPSDSGKGSPVSKMSAIRHGNARQGAQVKLPAVSSNSNSRTSSPARPWKPSAPGALSPGIAGTMPILPSTSPSPSNASPMLRHTLSARGAATAGVGAGGAVEHQGRLLSLQEDSQLLSSPRNELTLSQLFGGFPGSPGHSAVLQQQYSGGGNSSSSGFGPRAPSGGGAAGSYLGGLSREGTESPSRPRRVMSVPSSQLDRLALQHATQQKAAAAGTDSSTSSPRFHHPSSLAARVGHHPNFTNIALDVSAAAAAAGGPEGQLASAGPTPGSACDTPDSQSSPHSCLLESPSGSHQHAATRFKPKPRAPGSSSGGSASSTPHSIACPGSTASTPQLQPHPPQSSRKAAKPPVALAGGPGAGLGGSGAAYVPALDCGSPLDSPRLAAAAAAAAAVGGCDTPGSSGLRRARYSLSGGGLDPSSSLVGSLGSNSSSALLGTSAGRGGMGLMRSKSGLAGADRADSSTPTSPMPNLLTRTPGSGGPASTNPLLGKQSGNTLIDRIDGELTAFGVQMPAGVEGSFDGCFAPASAYCMPVHLQGAGGSSGGRASGAGIARDSSSGGGIGVAPLLGGVRESSFNSTGAGGSGGLAAVSAAGTRSPRGSSFTGVGEAGPGAAAAAAAAAAAVAASRPGSGKKTVTLLVDAVRSRDDTQLELLLQNCIKGVHGTNDRHPVTERTPLHEAVCLCSTSMVTLLLNAGSDPNVGHPKEGSPLLQAAAVGASDIVQLLLDAGANVAAVDVEGLTALHHACRSGHVDTARLLINKGADMRARTHDNESPIDLARMTVQQELCGGMSGGAGASEPSPTAASRRSSIDVMGRTSASGAAAAAAAATAAASVQGSSHPNTPTGSSGGGAAVARQLSGSSQSGTPRAAAAAAAHAAGADFSSRFAAAARGGLQAGGGSTLGSTTGDGSFTFSCDSTSTTTSAVSSPARAAARSSSCNGLALATSGGGGSSAAGSGAGGFLTMRRASSSSSGGLMPLAAGLGGGGGGGLLALVGPISSSGGGSAVNSPNGLTLQHSGIAAGGGLSGSSTPAGGHGSSGGGGGMGMHPASTGFSTPPISPSSLADAGPTGLRRPSPPVLPSSLSGMRGRLPSGLSSDGGSTTGDGGGGSGLPSALPSAVSSVLDQHPEERAPTPPVLQLPDRLFSSTSVRKPRLRATSKAPPPVEDTGRRDMEGDDQGPPAAAAAAAGGSSGGGGQPGSSCSSSSQPTPVSGAGLLLSSNSAADLTAPTPHGASILSGAASSSFAASSSGGGSGSNAGSSSRSAAEGGAQQLESALEGLTLRDIKQGETPAAAAQVAGQQQQQQQAQPPPLSPFAQQQQPAAAVPAFKFGLDPGSSSNMQEVAAAATAAAAAAAAAASAPPGQQQQQMNSSSNAGSSGHEALAQTFKLRLGDSVHRELQQAMQQQQQQQSPQQVQQQQQHQQQQHQQQQLQQQQQHLQQQPQQQQAGAWRNLQDPRFPPLLQGQTPPDTPGGAAAAAAAVAAGESSFTVLQPEELAAQQQHQQQQQQQQEEQGHVWESQGPQGQAMHWMRGELLGEGAYGQVYLGLNQKTGELMAVKTLPLVGRRGSKELEAQLQELKQELQCYQHLSHTHIVGYIGNEFDNASNSLYIFLEYVPGGSIASMVQRFGRFSEELARKYTRQLLLGLEYLHNKQIVHRDLKGGNALVSRSGVVKLTDFGASKIMNNAAQTDGMKSMRGSVFWMAPEVLKGKGYGRKADIWSLGCTVLEMLTAKHPWPDVDNHFAGMWTVANSCTGPPRPPGLSASASDFLDQCFKIDARERPTASQLLQHPWVALPASSNTTRTRAALSSDEGQG